jgi:hypothetical protein
MQIGNAPIIFFFTAALTVNDKLQRFVDQALEPSCKALPFR